MLGLYPGYSRLIEDPNRIHTRSDPQSAPPPRPNHSVNAPLPPSPTHMVQSPPPCLFHLHGPGSVSKPLPPPNSHGPVLKPPLTWSSLKLDPPQTHLLTHPHLTWSSLKAPQPLPHDSALGVGVKRFRKLVKQKSVYFSIASGLPLVCVCVSASSPLPLPASPLGSSWLERPCVFILWSSND